MAVSSLQPSIMLQSSMLAKNSTYDPRRNGPCLAFWGCLRVLEYIRESLEVRFNLFPFQMAVWIGFVRVFHYLLSFEPSLPKGKGISTTSRPEFSFPFPKSGTICWWDSFCR